MNRQRSWGLYFTVLVFLVLGIPHTRSQKTIIKSAQIEETTDYPKDGTTVDNFTHNVDITQSSGVEGQLDDVAISPDSDRDETVNIKITNKKPKVPESASRVIMPLNNATSNILQLDKATKRNTTTPVKHVIKDLEEDALVNFIEKKLSRGSKKGHVKYDENTGQLIDGAHPCQRECSEGEQPMICYYQFSLEWYQTMSKACYDCPFNAEDCERKDCIPADGMNRAITVINRKMPGPAIEVCQHDRIIVDIENDLMTEGTTVHWHGQHQRGTPYMDGTPYVTQCPVPPQTTFRYQFNASQAGTHFWHSHSGMQRADGAAGAMIVRKPRSQEPHARLYDYDRSLNPKIAVSKSPD